MPHPGTPHCKSPLVIGRVGRLQAEHLDPRPGRLVEQKPRPDDPRIVENDRHPGRQIIRHIPEHAFADLAATVKQKFGLRPIIQRKPRDPGVR